MSVLLTLGAAAQDWTRARLYNAMRAEHVLNPDRELVHFSHVCTLRIGGESYPVLDVRELVRGGPTPGGANYIVLLSAALKPVQKIEYTRQRPLFCVDNRLYISGDLAINNMQPEGDVLTFSDHGRSIHLKHVEPNEYGLPLTRERATPPE